MPTVPHATGRAGGGCIQWSTWLLSLSSSSDAWVQKIGSLVTVSFLFYHQIMQGLISNILIGRKNCHVFNKIFFTYSLSISYIWTIYFGHFHSQIPHPLPLGSLNSAPFPVTCLLEYWFILSSWSSTGLVKWPRFTEDTSLNVFILVTLSICVSYYFWILCNVFDYLFTQS